MTPDAQHPIPNEEATAEDHTDSQLHDLIPFVSRGRVFAVFTEHVEGTAEAKQFAPLPHTPAAVVGVACVHGRMLTVLDAGGFVNREPAARAGILPYVIALRGDEQFALLAEHCRDTITISAADIEPTSDESLPAGFAIGLVRYAGEEILVLDPTKLVSLALQRKERRRRRF